MEDTLESLNYFAGVEDALSNPMALLAWAGWERPYDWQEEAIKRVLRGEWVALRANNGSGKTQLIAYLGILIMAMYPGAMVVSTSGSWNLIETQLWPMLKNITGSLPRWGWNKTEVTGPRVIVDGRELQSVWRPFSTDDPRRAEGHHDREIKGKSGRTIKLPCAYFFDEAKAENADGVVAAMRRCGVSFNMIASSPGEDSGAFFRAFNEESELWSPIVVNWQMCPHLYEDPRKRAQIEAEIRVKGRQDPLIKSQYFAEFFTGGGYRVFDTNGIREAMSGRVPKIGSDRCAGFDWSAGSDEQVLIIREGNAVLEIMEWREKDQMRLADLLVKQFKRYGLTGNEIVCDVGGGGTVFVQLLASKGYHGIIQYENNKKAYNTLEYANKYTEDHFEKLSYPLRSIRLVKDEQLEREMKQREYTMSNSDSNARRLQRKEEIRKKGRPSPNRLDALCMAYSTWRPIDLGKMDLGINRQKGIRCPDLKDCMKKDDVLETAFGGWIGDSFA